MAPTENYYLILGVPRTASAAEIRIAYRRMALRTHPDKVGSQPDNNKDFRDAQRAYETLGDPQKRMRYDLSFGSTPRPPTAAPQPQNRPRTPRPSTPGSEPRPSTPGSGPRPSTPGSGPRRPSTPGSGPRPQPGPGGSYWPEGRRPPTPRRPSTPTPSASDDPTQYAQYCALHALGPNNHRHRHNTIFVRGGNKFCLCINCRNSFKSKLNEHTSTAQRQMHTIGRVLDNRLGLNFQYPDVFPAQFWANVSYISRCMMSAHVFLASLFAASMEEVYFCPNCTSDEGAHATFEKVEKFGEAIDRVKELVDIMRDRLEKILQRVDGSMTMENECGELKTVVGRLMYFMVDLAPPAQTPWW